MKLDGSGGVGPNNANGFGADGVAIGDGPGLTEAPPLPVLGERFPAGRRRSTDGDRAGMSVIGGSAGVIDGAVLVVVVGVAVVVVVGVIGVVVVGVMVVFVGVVVVIVRFGVVVGVVGLVAGAVVVWVGALR